MVLNRGWGVVQHGQQVLLHVPHLGCVDADAVHLPGSVVPAAHPPDAVAQVFQQIRQVCPLGGSHLLVRETKGCVLFRVAHLLIQNAKQPGGYSDGSGYPPGCLFDVVLDCLTGPVICPAGFWAWEIASGQSAAAQAGWSLSPPAASSIADSF